MKTASLPWSWPKVSSRLEELQWLKQALFYQILSQSRWRNDVTMWDFSYKQDPRCWKVMCKRIHFKICYTNSSQYANQKQAEEETQSSLQRPNRKKEEEDWGTTLVTQTNFCLFCNFQELLWEMGQLHRHFQPCRSNVIFYCSFKEKRTGCNLTETFFRMPARFLFFSCS